LPFASLEAASSSRGPSLLELYYMQMATAGKRSEREFAAHPTAPASQRPHHEPQPESSTATLHALATMAQWHDLNNTDQSTTSQAKPHKCMHLGCSYASARKRDLTRHSRIHTRERPFKCTHPGCSFASADGGSLTRHARTHRGEEPFKCMYPGCSHASARRSDLTRHTYTHTGEKPFKCTHPGCSYASARSDHLTKHMRNPHAQP
jgi:uncharacterized Zn-finger protein